MNPDKLDYLISMVNARIAVLFFFAILAQSVLAKEKEKNKMEGRTLRTVINKDSKTLKIMDAFEGRDRESFDRILVMNGIDSYVKCRNGKVRKVTYQYVIERPKRGTAKVGKIVMSNFKYGHNEELSQYVFTQLKRPEAETYIDKDEVFYFDVPYGLEAQYSGNREGYGSYYEWGNSVWEGTYYGETTSYVIAGVMITSRDF